MAGGSRPASPIFSNSGWMPQVGDADHDADADARHRAAASHQEAEGHRDHRHDQREERIGELEVVLHLELARVHQAALLQVGDVLAAARGSSSAAPARPPS